MILSKNRESQNDLQYERKLRLKRKLTWGIICLFGGVLVLLASGSFLFWAYRETGGFPGKLALIGIVGAALIVKGIVTLIKGEREDAGDDPVNPLFY